MKFRSWLGQSIQNLKWGKAAAGCMLAAQLMLPNAMAAAEPPPPSAFRTPDGAYFVTVGGQLVDPYFVNKSMIVGMQAGLDLRQPLQDWLSWLLPRQRKDGGFDRYCAEGSPVKWQACKGADADDSMAATFIQLVAMAKARGWIEPRMRQSSSKAVAAANRMLASLYNPANGLYRVFPKTELYYLMDSAEVHEAFVATGQTPQANRLAAAIRKQFYREGRWEPAIPGYKKDTFYPHALSAAYLWGMPFDLGEHGAKVQAETVSWLAQNSNAWLSRQHDPYSWGLVAWQLRRLAPIYTGCWRQSVRPYDGQVGWTVLDAFVDQSLAHLEVKPQCPNGLLPPPAKRPVKEAGPDEVSK